MLKRLLLGIWGISILYFIVYLLIGGLRVAVNASVALSIIHGCMALIFLFGIFGIIAYIIHYLFAK